MVRRSTIAVHDVEHNWASLEEVAAHEFFHLWNVKRIRPQRLEPIDYVHGNDTRDLWFCRGPHQHLWSLNHCCARGCSTGKTCTGGWRRRYSNFRIGPRGSSRVPKIPVARRGWKNTPTIFARNGASRITTRVRFSVFCSIWHIRHASHNQAGLDDVMRQLNTDFARRHRFFTSADLRAVIEKVAPAYREFESFDA